MSYAKMKFANRNTLYLYSTGVDNMFINEFMPAAPGDYVKVYLYGLMYVQYNLELDFKETAHTLGLTEDEVDKAWRYWSKSGVVRIQTDENDVIREILYLSLPEQVFGRAMSINRKPDYNSEADDGTEEEKREEAWSYADDDAARIASLINDSIRELYTQYEISCGRPISQKETQRISDAIKVFKINPDVMSYAIKYCSELEKYSIDYIFKVAMRWKEEGCRDISQVKEYLDKFSKKNADYMEIFKAVGFTRRPSPADKLMMDRWFEEMGFTLAEILEACNKTAGQREPTLKYVNRVLENRLLEKGGIDTRINANNRSDDSQYSVANSNSVAANAQSTAGRGETARVSNRVLEEYYKYLRTEAEKLQNAHIDELCAISPELRSLIEIENQMNQDLLTGQIVKQSREIREAKKQKRRALEEAKRDILRQLGYSEDYLNRNYKCKICSDSGATDEGRICVCTKQRAEEAYTWYRKIKTN